MVWKYCYIQQPIKNYKYLDSLALFQTIQFISWPCPFKVKYCFEYLSFWKAVRQGRYTIELRTNTILEVKRLANKTAVEVSVDSQKNKPAKQTCPDPSANTGPCDMETEEYSQSMGQSVRGETSSCDSDMALSLLSTDNGLNSPDCEFILIIIFFFQSVLNFKFFYLTYELNLSPLTPANLFRLLNESSEQFFLS